MLSLPPGKIEKIEQMDLEAPASLADKISICRREVTQQHVDRPAVINDMMDTEQEDVVLRRQP